MTGRGRRRPLAVAAIALAMVLLLGLVLAGGGAALRERRPAVPLEIAEQVATAPPVPAPARVETTAPAPGPSASRVIEETRAAALPRGRDSGWVREAPRAPLGPSHIVPLVPDKPAAAAAPAALAPGEPKPTLLFQPVASAAGRIEAAGHVVELEGIAVLDPARQCTGPDGQPWPCGTVARAQFRAWLRGRAVECEVAPVPDGKPVVTSCRLGKQDAAAWLVANGFAEAEPGGAYEQAGEEAKAARRGIFGDRPKRVSVTVGAGGGILPDLLQQTTASEATPAGAVPDTVLPPEPPTPEQPAAEAPAVTPSP